MKKSGDAGCFSTEAPVSGFAEADAKVRLFFQSARFSATFCNFFCKNRPTPRPFRPARNA